MPIVPDGGTVSLPTHKTLDLTVSGADGVQDSRLQVLDETIARVSVVTTDEFSVRPLAKGTTTLRAFADGDVNTGTLPLEWSATLTVEETVAKALLVTLHVEDEDPITLPQLASEVEIPINKTAQIRIVAIGKSGDPVTLDPDTIEWASGNEAVYTLVENGDNPQHGDLTPLTQLDFVPWTFAAAEDSTDPGGTVIAAGGVVSIKGAASTALVVDVDVV